MPYLVAALVLLVAGFGAGWKTNGWRYEADRAAEMRGARIALDATAAELAKLDIKQVTIRQKVQTNVIERTVYRECRHDPDTFRLLNDAITGKTPTPLVVVECPEIAPLSDDSFGATTLKLVEVAQQYNKCRKAALQGENK